MALPENVPTALVALDKPRRMALTLGAMRRVKERTGVRVTDLGAMPEEERLDHFHEFVWALLVNEDREGLSPEDVEEMLHPGNLQQAVDAFLALVGAAAPEGAEGNAGPVPPSVRAGKRRR